MSKKHLADESAQERAIYFTEAAARRNISPHVVEKDFWVCWTLDQLFCLKCLKGELIFKGGTSLSKGYNLIQRFSEDIDLSIHRESLGFGGDRDPAEQGLSQKERKRRIEALGSAARQKIAEEVLPELFNRVDQKLNPRDASLSLDELDPDGQTILFHYPNTDITSASGYIPSQVKIEFGARSDHWPADEQIIIPYVEETFPQLAPTSPTPIRIIDPVRTFWEKATILHRWAHAPEGKNLSRPASEGIAIGAGIHLPSNSQTVLNDPLKRI